MQINLSENALCGIDRYGDGTYTADGIKAIAESISVSPSMTSINLSSNNIAGVTETGYVKASKVQGSSFNVGDKVVYEGKEMVVSKAKDNDGDIKMSTIPDLAGIKSIADAIRVSPSVTSVDLSWNELGAEGAELLAPAIRDSTSVTSVRAFVNSWSSGG
jgi:NLR family CARD domain-containing protein 3